MVAAKPAAIGGAVRLSGLGPPARQDHRYAAPAAPQNIGRAEKSKTISLTPVGGSLVQAPTALSVFIGLIHLCGLIYERDR